MSGTIEQARTVLGQLEQALDVPRDETAAALRELIALAEVSAKTSTTTRPESLEQRQRSALRVVRLIS